MQVALDPYLMEQKYSSIDRRLSWHACSPELTLALHEPGRVVLICNPNTGEEEPGRPEM